MAVINSTLSNILLTGTSDNDTIKNGGLQNDFSPSGAQVTIYGGAGDDSINNEGSHSTINGGTGNDEIVNWGSNVTISAETGNDSIDNKGASVAIDGGDGSDSIFNDRSNVSINGGAGNDSIKNSGIPSNFSHLGSQVTIDGGGGDDYIENLIGSSVTIDGGGGNDTLYNGCYRKDDGSIYYHADSLGWGSNVVFNCKAGDGNDLIYGFKANSTFQIGDGRGTYSSQTSGNDIIVTVGEGKITLVGATNLSEVNISGNYSSGGSSGSGSSSDSKLITGTEYADSINNAISGATINALSGNDSIQNGGWWDNSSHDGGSSVTITAGAGNDYIYNNGNYVSIDAGDDNDKIEIFGNNVLIDGGDGNDTIYNYSSPSVTIDGGEGSDTIGNGGRNVTIDGGAGNDSIYNSGENVTIDGGAGNDSITNSGSRVTIVGRTGNDTISNSGSKVLFKYSSGDGKDLIYGFKADSTLSIGGSYSSTKSGDDIIVTVANGNITLVGVANLSTVNISGNYSSDGSSGGGSSSDSKLITGTEYADSIKNTISGATINALGGNDSIENRGSNVTIDGGAGDDSINNNGSNVTIDGGTGNDSIANGAGQVSIDCGEGNDCIVIGGESVSIDCGAGNDSIYNEYGASISIDGGDGNDFIYNCGSSLTIIDGGAGNDTISNNYDDYVYNSKVVFKYSAGDGNDIIYGFRADSTLSISGGSYSTQISGNDIIVTVGDGKISLIGAASLDAVNIVGTKTDTETNSWHLNGTTATYGTTSKTLVTVNGVKSTSGLSVNTTQKIVTIGASALGTSKVTVSDGYTLKLANGVSTPKSTAADWTHNGTKATYKSAGTTAGYTLANNAITYSSAKIASTLATVNGIKSNVTPSVKNKVITLKKANLSTNKVTVSGNGYEFKFDKGDYKKTSITGSANVDKITSNGSNVSVNVGKKNDTVKVAGSKTTINGGKGNDLISLTSAAKNNVIVYKSGDGNDTIYGLNEDDTLKITSGTAKVTTNNSDVIFTVGNGKITVKDGKDKKISYIDNTGAQTYSDLSSEVSISGKMIKLLEDYSEDSFNVDDYGKTLQTIDASAVQLDLKIVGNKFANKIIGSDQNDTLGGGKANDTITGGKGSDVFVYKEGDGNDSILDYKEEDIISIASGAASFKVDAKNIIVTVGTGSKKGTITLKNAADKVVRYIEGGEEKTYGDTISAVEVKGKTVTITENYTLDSFDLAGYAKTMKTINASAVTRDLEITGNKNANSILGGSGNDTLIGGKGNDNLKGGKGSDVFIYNKGDGNDIISDYEEEDKIQIASGNISNIGKTGNDVIFTVGSNKITVKSAASKTVTYLDASGNTKYYPTTPSSSILLTDSGMVILRSTYSESSYAASSSIKKIDASAVPRNLSITGNSESNVILGGSEDDTIYGGKGNDTLQGDTGADTFVYANGDGKDIILDYEEDDIIKITKGTAEVATKDKNVIFTVGSGKITVRNAANKTVTYIEGNEKKTHGSSASFIEDDTNYELTPNLSSIVQSKSADYSFLSTSTKLTKETNLIAYSGKK